MVLQIIIKQKVDQFSLEEKANPALTRSQTKLETTRVWEGKGLIIDGNLVVFGKTLFKIIQITIDRTRRRTRGFNS